jgi:uncharacterized membrane protein
MSNLFSILFAPSFVLMLHFFEFKLVSLAYLLIAMLFFIYSWRTKKSYRDMFMPTIYLIALSLASYFSSFETVKFIPVALSMIFLTLFIDSHYNKREFVLNLATKFSHKEFSQAEKNFLKDGDFYWIFVMLINTSLLIYVANYSSNIVWAFYTSIGSYILFFVSLIGQILYGKLYAIKMYYR